jgi:hypothetical protein
VTTPRPRLPIRAGVPEASRYTARMNIFRVLALTLAVVLVVVAAQPAPAEAVEPSIILLAAGVAVAVIVVIVVVVIANVRSSQRGESALMIAHAGPEQTP